MAATESPNEPRVLYPLPHASEAAESERLDEQHFMLKLHLNGLYPCPDLVEHVLGGSAGQPKAVLDLGSGSGAWCLDMAHQFPNARIVGVDVAPHKLQTVPLNCKFELWDIDKGLSSFYNKFDLVHMRFVHGLRDHHASMIEARKCLKPGGLIVLIFAGPYVTEDRMELCQPATSRNLNDSWLQRFWWVSHQGGSLLGSSYSKVVKDYDEGFWSQANFDSETCGAAYITAPVGPWPAGRDAGETARLKRVGEFWKTNLMTIHKLLDRMLIAAGRTPKDIEILHTRIDEEISNPHMRMSMTIRSIWGCTHAAPERLPHERFLKAEDMSHNPVYNDSVYRIITLFKSKESWTEFNEELMSTIGSDGKSLYEIPGFDLIEA